ncbi:MAG: glycosyltransferase family 1 protein [Propionibacteriaceae bacterium]|jgi:hypothetical protein|nr:glycosyltransferase family 1 protein [Propionibacteriaceae bacterium]
MRIAIRHEDLIIEPNGEISGHDAGTNLVKRLLRVFPGSILVGSQPARHPDFEVAPLDQLAADDTLLINMNVIDSVSAWRTLSAQTASPRIMNFVWWDTTRFRDKVEQAELALSCALFPTFANSERTARAIAELVGRLAVKPLAERARISGVNLGIRLERVQSRHEPKVPVVLYPAIYVSARKQPRLFIDVVTKVARKTEIQVEARLTEAHLVSEPAMELSRQRWASVGPLKPSREEYWDALSHTTAFLATAEEESYGLEYIEALLAGAVGVFPDRSWARALLPAKYPFLYTTPGQAEAMLLRAVTDTEACRRELDQSVEGSFDDWLRAHHDDDAFESAVAEHVRRWFGPVG